MRIAVTSMRRRALLIYTHQHMQPVMIYMEPGFSQEALENSDALDLRSIGDKAWSAITSRCKASEVRLYYLKIKSLEGIEKLRSTSILKIEYANKITDIKPVLKMDWLETLYLYDLPKLRDIEGIEALQNLTELRLSGNRGSMDPPLRLQSIKPIAKLSKLRVLEVTNMQLENDDISFIASSFPNLRSLTISWRFDRSQLAHIAAKLNAQLDEPLRASIEFAHCTKCKGSLTLFIGRRMPTVCKVCNKDKFEKLTAQFAQLMREA
jgi:hypothetical protein